MKKLILKILLGIAKFFWRRAIRFMKKNEIKPVGIPWQRDPENPCEFFEPFKKSPNMWQDCETDGHYMCGRCYHNIKNNPQFQEIEEPHHQ